MRPKVLIVLLAAAVLVGACTDAAPCSICPPLEGTYGMSYQQEQSSCAGPDSSRPPEVLTIERIGSALHATISVGELRGTLYDTFDFTLGGSLATLDGGSDSIQLNGRFVPPSSQSDGGTEIRGGYTSRSLPSRPGEQACTRRQDFVGLKR